MAPPGWLDAHLDTLRAVYRTRSDALVRALDERLGGRFERTEPQGGMFLWLTAIDRDLDTVALLDAALACGVAFVPGPAFAVDADLRRSLRLSFATVDPEHLTEAVDRLARALER